MPLFGVSSPTTGALKTQLERQAPSMRTSQRPPRPVGASRGPQPRPPTRPAREWPLWTANHPSCSCFLWAGDRLCLQPPAKPGCVPSNSPRRPPAGGQAACVPGGWEPEILHTKLSGPESARFCLPVPLDAPGCWTPIHL